MYFCNSIYIHMCLSSFNVLIYEVLDRFISLQLSLILIIRSEIFIQDRI